MTRATHAASRSRLWLRRAPVRSGDATGDTAAFEAVYRDTHQDLYRYARSIVRDDHLAEDVLQSVMEKALAALQTEERDFELRPWLFRITHNEAISRLRQDKPVAELPDALASGSRSLDDQLDDQSKLDTLWTDLQVLPDRQRQSLVLRELSGLSHEEIAAVIDSTPRSVKQTIFEARRALLECEEGREMVCDDVQRQLSDGDGRVRRGRRMQAHLRSCRDCRAFDRALNDRPQDLRALAPALPAAAAAGVLAHLVPGAKLASTASAAAGAAGAATAGGLATSGGWSLGALGGAFATKTAVVAATTVAAVGATGVVVAERAQRPDRSAAPAAGAGAVVGAGAAAASASGNGAPAPGTAGSVGTTPGGASGAAGPPATTPSAAPRDTTPGSARGQERRADGQARAAEARSEARERKAAAASGANAKSAKTAKPSRSAKAKAKVKASAKAKSSSGSSKSTSSVPKSSSTPTPPKRSPAPASGRGPTRGADAAPKAPAAGEAPSAADPSTGSPGGSPPGQADSGAQKKSEK